MGRHEITGGNMNEELYWDACYICGKRFKTNGRPGDVCSEECWEELGAKDESDQNAAALCAEMGE